MNSNSSEALNWDRGPKRRKLSDDGLGSDLTIPKRTKRCAHEDYTIAWVCALHIELAASRAVLDETHEDPGFSSNDSNCYTLGSIRRHNVVLACLPAGQYGTINAAEVLTNLRRTFTNVRMAFMVGIGGAAPSQTADIRLGDIVVGTKVIQYDLVKAIGVGQVRRTATPRIPNHTVLAAIAHLRSIHEERDQASRICQIMKDRFASLPKYGHPDVPDRLFNVDYEHPTSTSDCNECDVGKLVVRRPRRSSSPRIHYGTIASGNQVVKCAAVRDEVAQALDAICFEMEAAGLMDILPCLAIRGICDYADSHKSKEWQEYAAATAAAYAREFLEILPPSQLDPGAGRGLEADSPEDTRARRKQLMNSLAFGRMNSRKATISAAHGTSCRWFLENDTYKAWRDGVQSPGQRGFLWISGKPGAGKSTLMKFIYSRYTNWRNRSKNSLRPPIISFFFNARGEGLEKSTYGMYRHLLLQIFEAYPDLQDVLDNPDLAFCDGGSCPPLELLREMFNITIIQLRNRPLTIFIDALDECSQEEVAELVESFENLAHQASDNGTPLRICFSSRHYPDIQSNLATHLTLERLSGHDEDMGH